MRFFFLVGMMTISGITFSQRNNFHYSDHSSTFSQNKNYSIKKEKRKWEAEVGGLALIMPVGSLGGLSLHAFAPLGKHFFNGGGFSLGQGTIVNNFGYNTTQANLEFVDLDWTTEYRFFNKRRLKMNFCIATAITFVELGDGGQKTILHTSNGTPYTQSKDLADNTYVSIQPGINFFIPLSRVGDGLYIQYNYRFMMGYSEFGEPSNFNGSCIQIGIRGLAN